MSELNKQALKAAQDATTYIDFAALQNQIDRLFKENVAYSTEIDGLQKETERLQSDLTTNLNLRLEAQRQADALRTELQQAREEITAANQREKLALMLFEKEHESTEKFDALWHESERKNHDLQATILEAETVNNGLQQQLAQSQEDQRQFNTEIVDLQRRLDEAERALARRDEQIQELMVEVMNRGLQCPECGGSMSGAGSLNKCVACTASGLGA